LKFPFLPCTIGTQPKCNTAYTIIDIEGDIGYFSIFNYFENQQYIFSVDLPSLKIINFYNKPALQQLENWIHISSSLSLVQSPINETVLKAPITLAKLSLTENGVSDISKYSTVGNSQQDSLGWLYFGASIGADTVFGFGAYENNTSIFFIFDTTTFKIIQSVEIPETWLVDCAVKDGSTLIYCVITFATNWGKTNGSGLWFWDFSQQKLPSEIVATKMILKRNDRHLGSVISDGGNNVFISSDPLNGGGAKIFQVDTRNSSTVDIFHLHHNSNTYTINDFASMGNIFTHSISPSLKQFAVPILTVDNQKGAILIAHYE